MKILLQLSLNVSESFSSNLCREINCPITDTRGEEKCE